MYLPHQTVWTRPYPFLPVPLAIIDRFHELAPPDLSASDLNRDFRVLLVLARLGFAKPDWPTVAASWPALVKLTRLSKDTCRRACRSLAQADLLSIFPGSGPLSVNRFSLQPLINRLYLLHYDYAIAAQLVPSPPQQLTMFAEDPSAAATPTLRADVLSRRDAAKLEAYRLAERKDSLSFHNGDQADTTRRQEAM